MKRANEKRYRGTPLGKAARRRQQQKFTAELSDEYVRDKLSGDTGIKRAMWPAWLVQLKRMAIQLKRKYGIHQNRRGRTIETN